MLIKTPRALLQLLQLLQLRQVLLRLQATCQPLRTRLQQHSELTHMSTRELNDLGIGRSDIPALLYRPATWLADRTGN